MAKRFKLQKKMADGAKDAKGKPAFEDWKEYATYTNAKQAMFDARGEPDDLLWVRMVDTEGEHPAEMLRCAGKQLDKEGKLVRKAA
jgi:hypothetical protein